MRPWIGTLVACCLDGIQIDAWQAQGVWTARAWCVGCRKQGEVVEGDTKRQAQLEAAETWNRTPPSRRQKDIRR